MNEDKGSDAEFVAMVDLAASPPSANYIKINRRDARNAWMTTWSFVRKFPMGYQNRQARRAAMQAKKVAIIKARALAKLKYAQAQDKEYRAEMRKALPIRTEIQRLHRQLVTASQP